MIWGYFNLSSNFYDDHVLTLLEILNRKGNYSQAVVVHVFNPSTTQETEAADLCEFKASLVCRASPRAGSKATDKPGYKGKKRTVMISKQYDFVISLPWSLHEMQYTNTNFISIHDVGVPSVCCDCH